MGTLCRPGAGCRRRRGGWTAGGPHAGSASPPGWAGPVGRRSHAQSLACRASIPMKRCTASVWWRLRKSWRLLLPRTFRHVRGAPPVAALQRLRARPTEVRSLRARSASPRSERARRRRASTRACVTRSRPCRRASNSESRGADTPSRRPRSRGAIQGQSDTRSRVRFSAGFNTAGSRWPEVTRPEAPGGASSGIRTLDDGGSAGRTPLPST